MKKRLGTAWPPLAVFAGFIGVWYFYSGVILDEVERNISLPYFHNVVDIAFLDGENRSELLSATWTSAWIAGIGLAIAVALGLFFAVLMSQAKWIERSFYPYAVLLQTIPILALVPVIGLRFGFGIGARVIVVVIISLFPIITNTLFGLKTAEQGHHDLFTLHKASRVTRLFKLQFPSALPAMFTGFQISAGLAVIGEIVGGFFFGRGATDLRGAPSSRGTHWCHRTFGRLGHFCVLVLRVPSQPLHLILGRGQPHLIAILIQQLLFPVC
jgi:NitT/TauT family transport system permease protein